MWATILSALATLAATLLKTFIQTPPAVAVEAKSLGTETQIATDEGMALQNVQKAQEAAAAVDASAAAARLPNADSRD